MEWMPIDTAPKDGTWILTFDAGKLKNFPGEDNSDINLMNVQQWADGYRDEGWYKDCNEYGDKCPTHWMPLPEAPKP